MTPETASFLRDYMAVRDTERQERVARVLASFGEREQRAIREAAVIGYVNGAYSAGGHKAEIPHDRDIVVRAIAAALSLPDLYPTLAEAERQPGGEDA